MMRPEDAAKKAAELVGGERQAVHGEPSMLFATIARLWQAYLSSRIGITPLEGSDVAALMTLFKIARTMHGSRPDDSWIDAAGYSSIGAYLKRREDDLYDAKDVS